MPELPDYPTGDTGDSNTRRSEDRDSKTFATRSTLLWWVAGIALLVLFVGLHLTGVLGPEGH